MKTQTILLLAFLFLIQYANSQIVIYGYDKSGNRISVSPESKNSRFNLANISTDEKSVENLSNSDSLSIFDIQKVNVKFNQNPTRGNLLVTISNYDFKYPSVIEIHSMYGRKIYSTRNVTQVNSINISDQPIGVYNFYLIVNKQVKIVKIQKI